LHNFLEILLHFETEYQFHFLNANGVGSLLLDSIDVALIGAGRMGHVHGPNAARQPGLRLKYVVDPRAEAAAFARAHGASMASLEQALADPAIGGVLICSTTDQHLGHALAAVEAGTQAALLAPTEILARQHFATLQAMVAGLPVNIAILTGRDKGRVRGAPSRGRKGPPRR